MDEYINLEIDGAKVNVKKGINILEAAKDIGIHIPTLCYHPALSPFGACRLCSVEIIVRGRKRIITSCNYPVEEGLIVDTKSQGVITNRKMILELLLARCPKVKKIQDLAKEYGIETSRFKTEDENCILCGLCTRVCEEIIGASAINFASRGVNREVIPPYNTLSNDCISCGACDIICPTGSTKLWQNVYPLSKEDILEIENKFLNGARDENLGVYTDIFSASTPIQGQDGGMVTSLLISGLDNAFFDAAIVVQLNDGYKVNALIADNSEDILKAKGTKYVRVKMVSLLNEAIEKGKKKIAFVGTPCQVKAVRKIQLSSQLSSVDTTVLGLFCFESFLYKPLKEEIQRLLGVDLDKTEKIQISKGKFIVSTGGKQYSCRVRKLSGAVKKGCRYCDDFSAKLADISIGSVGSPDGCSTVIVRSKKGKKLLSSVSFKKGKVDKDEIVKLAKLKQNNARKNFSKIIEGLQE